MNFISNKLKPFIFIVLISVNLSIHVVEGCHPNDERALLRIKSAFNNVSIFSSFIPHTDCCNWNQVGCKVFPDASVPRVNFLSIFDSDEVVGVIPSAIAELTYLQTLVLSNLPNLTGPVSNVFSRLKHIHTLELDNNNLLGTIPGYLGRIPTLRRLNLQSNHLYDSIPPGLGALMPNCVLILSNNYLSGPLPPSLGRVNFDILDLSNNALGGDASLLFGKDKTYVGILNLSYNLFSFDLANVKPFGGYNTGLSSLFLDNNLLYGQLPAWLGQATNMISFNVSFNSLCGAIPTIGGKLQGFDASAFSNNRCLCGAPLPPCNSSAPWCC